MKFSIITPTFRRKELLERAVASCLAQTYKDWELLIVNDSPMDLTYKEFTSSINDPRIHYHENSTNKGVNYSRNLALNKVSSDSKWIIFLDDDDYFAPDTLKTFSDLILLYDNSKWFLTNRATNTGISLTIAPHDDTSYSYAWSYLIGRRIRGDATHCIETKLITQLHAQFSKYVKQGEEWFFFYQIGLHTRLFYHDHNSTISGGYNPVSGLNFRKRTIGEQLETLSKLLYEGRQRKTILSPTFILYLLMRLIKIFIR